MTELSLQAALNLLETHPEQYNSQEALFALAERINVNATGEVTILYSGNPLGTDRDEDAEWSIVTFQKSYGAAGVAGLFCLI
ncbi:hypothetical protein C3432_11690 [Citrobacter amalonaticus]|uniref:Uncharacterized protein n=1 Tax=Citrobacter amalonaticus TaxID=35703 RepID=A0A2S4RPV4_CITAM|nr:hypothetical protein [Citrobacter amalonaticus]POT58537.1 hypothetical protein C3432_11690 [Citrobacter amalonaticus]POT75937.1 hypothetical protein C3436_00125 [Citrobacter amalonaticus]POU59101.1 hypothetical protein C3430_26875 [Citrobacter amalonaticus]POV05172.1 hypothetical protein C3424_07430 [Citrobacter amalonaticus]